MAENINLIKQEIGTSSCDKDVAMRDWLMHDLLKRYKEAYLSVPLDHNGADELYKWQLITECEGKSELDIIQKFKTKNIVDVARVNQVLTALSKDQPQQLADNFALLTNEDVPLPDRLSDFKSAMGELCGDKYNMKANDERTASAFLACWNPYKYTFYKDEIYQNYCIYINETTQKAGNKYPHYLQLLESLVQAIQQDAELLDKFATETDGMVQSDLLIAQNILWQMKDMMKKGEDKYVRFKHLLEYFVSHLEWCSINDTSFIGYNSYIKPLLDTKRFNASGQGWKGHKIQEQIDEWSVYDANTVLINVYGANYQSNACYLNWETTWINVRPQWDNSHIVSLYLSKEEKSSAKEENSKSIQELGLFDNKGPNQLLKDFFDEYEKMLLMYNGTFSEQQLMEQVNMYSNILRLKKNIILQGAPGTGKTYNTAALALAICGEQIPEDHGEVMRRYEELQKEGRIGFVTFHQSMDYEDFVEGIKPKTENGMVSYEVEDGIFKLICRNATSERSVDPAVTITKETIVTKPLSSNESIYLKDTIFESVFRSVEQDIKNKTIKVLQFNGNAAPVKFENNKIYFGNKSPRTVNKNNLKLFYDYFLNKNKYDISEYSRDDFFRLISDLTNGQTNTVDYIYYGAMLQEMLKRAKHVILSSVEPDDVVQENPSQVDDITVQEETGSIEQNNNYVLIIDEINRGNVSKIFGELITLLEADKRIGGDHPIKVTLPYSKELFGVPSNLYIIGTMNTTDRSVGNIDYAVRRRFAFATLKADKELVRQNSLQLAVELFESVELFIKKHQIDMDFEDLMVGHSYFFAKDENELELKWQYEILPLLNEYIKDGIINTKPISSDKTIANFVGEWHPALAE